MKKTENILCYGFILLLLLADIAVLAYFLIFLLHLVITTFALPAFLWCLFFS